MSYESTVIANGVDAFWRLNEEEINHSTIAATLLDASGNNNHATCFETYVAFPLRHVHDDPLSSPILNDPGSRVMSGRIGHIVDPTNRLDTFAWQGWHYNLEGSANKALLCRTSHFASNGANILGYGNSQEAYANLRIGTTTYTLRGTDALVNAWNYLVLNKLEDSIQLWVNACLAQEIVGVVGDINVSTYTEFYLGAQFGANTFAWYSKGSHGIAIGPSLTETKIIQNFESAGYTRDCPGGVPGFRNYCLSIDEDIN